MGTYILAMGIVMLMFVIKVDIFGQELSETYKMESNK